MFMLVRLPNGVPQTRLAEISTALRKHAAAVMMILPESHKRLPVPAETGVAAIAYQCSGGKAEEAVEIQAINRFVHDAAKAGFRTVAYDVHTVSLGASSTAAGMDYIIGDVIGPVLDMPRSSHRFTVADLYGNAALGP
jgi:hypothetical protein